MSLDGEGTRSSRKDNVLTTEQPIKLLILINVEFKFLESFWLF